MFISIIVNRLLKEEQLSSWRNKPMISFPQFVPIEQYEYEQKYYIESMLHIVPNMEVFDFGIVGTPGISDIDLLCIIPDETSIRAKESLASLKLSELFAHPPIILPNSARQYMRFLLPISHFRAMAPLANIPHPPPPLPQDEKLLIALLDCFNAVIVRWKAFLVSRAAPVLNVHKLLLNIWSARHSIICAEEAGLPLNRRWRLFMDNAAEHRAIWRRESRIDIPLFYWLLEEVTDIMTEIADSAAHAILQRVTTANEATSLMGGRSLLVSAVSGQRWQMFEFKLKVGRRTRRYFKFSLPEQAMALLNWKPYGNHLIDQVARKRIEVTQKRNVISMSNDRPECPLAYRLVDHNAASCHKQLIDVLALKAIDMRRAAPLDIMQSNM